MKEGESRKGRGKDKKEKYRNRVGQKKDAREENKKKDDKTRT